MKEFSNKVAVITGAANGIGLSIAEKFLREGMKIVLADIELDVLSQAEKELKKISPNVLTVLTDVQSEFLIGTSDGYKLLGMKWE